MTESSELAPGIGAEPRRIPFDTSGDLDMVFTIDLDAWAPRPAVYRAAVEFAENYGFRIPGSQQVFKALRARGFTETKRRGTWGFVGIDVPNRLREAPRLVPAEGTASSYYRGDRTDAAKEAAFDARMRRKTEVIRKVDAVLNPGRLEIVQGQLHLFDKPDVRPPLSPWAATPRTEQEREIIRIEAMGRRYRGKLGPTPWER